MQLYMGNETPITPDADGLSRVWRDEEEVFQPGFLASLQGKPVVDDHPTEDVNPENWRNYTQGIGLNPRRGEGELSDLVLQDLLIMDKFVISEVQAGKREISVGYDADYEQIAPGQGRQTSLIANHIALVQRGRCGSRCSIGDEAMTLKQLKEKILKAMQDGKKPEEVASVLDELNTPTRSRTADCADADDADDRRRGAKDDTEDRVPKKSKTAAAAAGGRSRDDDTDDADADDADAEDRGRRFSKARARYTDSALDAKFGKIEDTLDKILDKLESKSKDKDADTDDRRRGAKDSSVRDEDLVSELPSGIKITQVHDSVYLEDSFQETVSTAEIIVPGIKIPTFDAKMDPRKTLDSMCSFRKHVLELAYNQPTTRMTMDEMLRGKELDTADMPCQRVRDMFFNVGMIAKQMNTKQSFTPAPATAAGRQVVGTIKSISDLNKFNQTRYSETK
jgi:uncharacterized protein